MEKGQIVEVKIEDMSSEGQGIGKADGFVVFVPGAVIGDSAKVKLTKVKKTYGFAELIQITEMSPLRYDDFDCSFSGNGCGGCQYGMLSYDAQLSLKERQVREKLQRIAGIEGPAIRPIIGMQDEDNDGSGSFRYRNKAQFPVSTGGIITRKGGIVENLGKPAVGFFRSKSHEVVDCGDCYLQSMAAMAAADALRQFMEEDNITAWDPKWEKGLLRHLIVKTGFESGEVMVILVINGNGVPNIQKLVEMLDEAIYEVGYSLESVVLSIKKSKSKGKGRGAVFNGGEIMGDKNVVVAGKPVINDYLGSVKFEISPASFYQVNPVQTKRLYDRVREYCGFSEDETAKPVILDLYCGVGSIGLYCADRAEAIVGIEAVQEAVIDANRNAVINGIVNARYICGKAEKVLPEYMACSSQSCLKGCGESDVNSGGKTEENGPDPDIMRLIRRAEVAVIDPPRAGCRPELLEALAKTNVKRIVYVSCDPATLARDIKFLYELGYEFTEATPVDMFPHTTSTECVAMLSRKN